MKKIIIMLICLLNMKIIMGDILCDPYEDVHMQIKKDFEFNEILNYANIIWPSCQEISNKAIPLIEITELQKTFAKQWYLNVVSCTRRADSIIFLANMKNGDDWILSCSKKCGTYAQMIDGRTLTILINKNIEYFDSTNISNRFFSSIQEFINLNIFFYKSPKINIIKKDSTVLYGEIIDSGDSISNKIQKDKNLFWIYKNYTILDIVKKKKPFRYRNTISPGAYIIGGIERNDKRPFIRFGKNTFDFDKEMKKDFQITKDSSGVEIIDGIYIFEKETTGSKY